MKEEELEKGDRGLPTRKDFFWDFVGHEPKWYLADKSQTR